MPNRDIGDQRRIAPDVSIVGLDDRPFAAPYRSLTSRPCQDHPGAGRPTRRRAAPRSGLRRSEVAALAGMSAEYYARSWNAGRPTPTHVPRNAATAFGLRNDFVCGDSAASIWPVAKSRVRSCYRIG
jgi:hypothetical protein